MFNACLPERFKNCSKRKACHGLPARQGGSHFTSLPQVLKLSIADAMVQRMCLLLSCKSYRELQEGCLALFSDGATSQTATNLSECRKPLSHRVSRSNGATSYYAMTIPYLKSGFFFQLFSKDVRLEGQIITRSRDQVLT